MESIRPGKKASKSVYSNLNHTLDKNIVKLLRENANILYAQHAAWNFCGYIWFDSKEFKEEVWQYKFLTSVHSNKDIRGLIAEVVGTYGRD